MEIKSNEQMGASYMKMEERDRMLVEKGEIIGIVSIVRKVMENIVKFNNWLNLKSGVIFKSIISLFFYDATLGFLFTYRTSAFIRFVILFIENQF